MPRLGVMSPLDFSWQFLRVCCWWPWRFWGVLIRGTVEDASVGICLVMFFLCLGCGSEFLRGRSQRWSVEFITSYQAYMLPRWFMTHGADLDQRLMQCLSGFSADKVLFTCLSTLSSLEGGHYAQPTFRVGSNAPPPWGWSIHTLFGSLLHRFVSSPPLLMHSLIFFSVKQCTGPQSLWHQGLVLWKTVFPQTGVGGMVWGWVKLIKFIVLRIICICSHSPVLASLSQLYLGSSDSPFSQGAQNLDPSRAQFTIGVVRLWEFHATSDLTGGVTQVVM